MAYEGSTSRRTLVLVPVKLGYNEKLGTNQIKIVVTGVRYDLVALCSKMVM